MRRRSFIWNKNWCAVPQFLRRYTYFNFPQNSDWQPWLILDIAVFELIAMFNLYKERNRHAEERFYRFGPDIERVVALSTVIAVWYILRLGLAWRAHEGSMWSTSLCVLGTAVGLVVWPQALHPGIDAEVAAKHPSIDAQVATKGSQIDL